jgi:hypothetical protein
MEAQSKERCMKRCAIYEEELMHNRWHPDRIVHMYHMGYVVGDM